MFKTTSVPDYLCSLSLCTITKNGDTGDGNKKSGNKDFTKFCSYMYMYIHKAVKLRQVFEKIAFLLEL